MASLGAVALTHTTWPPEMREKDQDNLSTVSQHTAGTYNIVKIRTHGIVGRPNAKNLLYKTNYNNKKINKKN